MTLSAQVKALFDLPWLLQCICASCRPSQTTVMDLTVALTAPAQNLSTDPMFSQLIKR
jgi:hypothetical protein